MTTTTVLGKQLVQGVTGLADSSSLPYNSQTAVRIVVSMLIASIAKTTTALPLQHDAERTTTEILSSLNHQ
jgi:hypothetical protein